MVKTVVNMIIVGIKNMITDRLLCLLIVQMQGWVDYKSFVVRYNYSYFKNMWSATTTATFKQE